MRNCVSVKVSIKNFDWLFWQMESQSVFFLHLNLNLILNLKQKKFKLENFAYSCMLSRTWLKFTKHLGEKCQNIALCFGYFISVYVNSSKAFCVFVFSQFVAWMNLDLFFVCIVLCFLISSKHWVFENRNWL